MSDEMLEFFAPETAKKAHKPRETYFEVVIPCKEHAVAERIADQLRTNRITGVEVREVAK